MELKSCYAKVELLIVSNHHYLGNLQITFKHGLWYHFHAISVV